MGRKGRRNWLEATKQEGRTNKIRVVCTRPLNRVLIVNEDQDTTVVCRGGKRRQNASTYTPVPATITVAEPFEWAWDKLEKDDKQHNNLHVRRSNDVQAPTIFFVPLKVFDRMIFLSYGRKRCLYKGPYIINHL
ncbi:hypothetical protein AVEN_172964-1 [Araneus ventricosus]|uniref:Uncharacterized protein n=1 Tax=Araneus ventricosus TaxID=182803 RepID=A0A4Y2FY35_ARAVE|nr:hypothetical protein AVEN_172964-1 [Araneus ventricosus]